MANTPKIYLVSVGAQDMLVKAHNQTQALRYAVNTILEARVVLAPQETIFAMAEDGAILLDANNPAQDTAITPAAEQDETDNGE